MSSATGRTYRCSIAARWLPRALAGATLTAALLAAYGLDPQARVGGSGVMRGLVVALGAILALWLLRAGGELRLEVDLPARDAGSDAPVRLRRGGRQVNVEPSRLARFEYHSPFAASRSWVPAMVLRDRYGLALRLPAMLEAGDRMVSELVAWSGRDDLEAWVDALGLRRRMGRASRLVATGYVVAVAILLGGVVLYLR